MHCHTNPKDTTWSGGSIALIGHPNVGKSVIFQHLTGQRVAVSNYPGTTVEVARGAVRSLPETSLVDTPGVITFPPHSDDEQVTARVLLNEPLQAILQVGDAKNLRRTLQLTVQLAEMEQPLVLALNMMDEAKARGVVISESLLSEHLSVPVVPTTAVRGQGVDTLLEKIQTAPAPQFRLTYPAEIEAAVASISARIEDCPISPRALALLWLSGDQVSGDWLRTHLSPAEFSQVEAISLVAQRAFQEPLSTLIQNTRLEYVERIAQSVIMDSGTRRTSFSEWLGRMTTHPVWGLGILALVLYSLYWFVGILGASILVGFLEEQVFGEVINPAVTTWIQNLIPVPILADFLVGSYGQWTMGVTYALALILPIVTTFFLAFGVLEDSGYLPRLAALSNRFFQALGLNGKAVLPMVLGLGCVTMATVTTRVLENRRERLLVTLLLALAVPCSAQLGVVMGMLAGVSFSATLIWSGVILLVLMAVGWLAARLMPGERSSLLVELPPLRLPQFSNVALKTLARLEWYIKEVVPLFLLGAALMFILDRTGILKTLIHLGEPLVTGWLGLPAEASAAFLMGFLRRDFGATGLFLMQSQGLLSPVQVVVSMVTITLFIPCIASVMMIAKERSWKTALGMLVFIIPLAFLVGGVLNLVLIKIGWAL